MSQAHEDVLPASAKWYAVATCVLAAAVMTGAWLLARMVF